MLSAVIPQDHAIWSVMTDELVGDLIRELANSTDRSPAMQRLHDIVVQHPSIQNASSSASNSANRRVSRCIRDGVNVPLRKRKRKKLEGDVADMEPNAKKGKGKSWETDGVAPGPTQEASMMVADLGSAISAEGLPSLVKLVQALITGKRGFKPLEIDDNSFEAT